MRAGVVGDGDVAVDAHSGQEEDAGVVVERAQHATELAHICVWWWWCEKEERFEDVGKNKHVENLTFYHQCF